MSREFIEERLELGSVLGAGDLDALQVVEDLLDLMNIGSPSVVTPDSP